jgi:hypothetical protein
MKATTKVRLAVKPLVKSKASIAADAKIERDRKAASKAALHAAIDKAAPAPTVPAKAPAIVLCDAHVAAKKRADEAAATLEAQRVDYDALQPEGQSFDDYLAAQGFAPDGTPLTTERTGYQGPMLALVSARKSYIKASNGQLTCDDELARLLGKAKPPVIRAALFSLLGGNRWPTLNPGQQSMNARNTVRGMVKDGALTHEQIKAALDAALAAA